MFVDGNGAKPKISELSTALSYGRFMQPDPIGYGDGLNWYNYVGNDPINGRDPTGTLVTCTGSIIAQESCSNVAFLSCSGNCSSFWTPQERADAGIKEDIGPAIPTSAVNAAVLNNLSGPYGNTVKGSFDITNGKVSYSIAPTNYLGARGANISITYKGSTTGLDWRQIAYTDSLSIAALGHPVNQWFQDGSALPSYYTRDVMNQVTTPTSTRFYDTPRAGGSYSFEAITSLVDTRSGGALFSLRWGYQVSTEGRVNISRPVIK